jgi:hypothetical protein
MKPNVIVTLGLFIGIFMTLIWQTLRSRVDIPVVLNVKVKPAAVVLLSCV